ncbi:anti-sigma-K factor RskA [Mycobacterium sp. BK558]|uniref:Anti-sigma-K factor RskA n=1 Tax=Mycolicibacterium chlorophenolicum TaxID=37916 RepID=A0A0J6VBV3_9MYCO|nr:anti-sigma factor [Mycolicibacterium chlorophenolicum]KMO67669.1 Anti-sigma-K factor RskA [Mycolicibacterium chlorophenolicum]MBI5338642.1 anti-sigma factor [Mycolicibacterium rufum]RZT25692.1 anti-sigma-K factor RskA [Mycobacterium sp. BK558]
MTSPEDLLSLATPYALHALSDAEVDDIDRRLRDAPPGVAEAFSSEVRAVRETMAVIAEATAVEPPAELRAQVLAQIAGDPVRALRPRTPKPRRWTTSMLAAAAVVAVGLATLGVGLALRPNSTTSTADQVFAAPDVRTVSGEIPGGGTATVVFSRERDSGVLVMNNVPPPKPGTVYQMWLVAADGPHSAGTMDAKAVAPSTTAVLPDLGSSRSLAFTVEPPGGSTEPTGPAFAELPLV